MKFNLRKIFLCLTVLSLLLAMYAGFLRMTDGRKRWVHPEIRGTILDDQTGLPIAGVKVKLINSQFGGGSTLTDQNGVFALDAVSQKYRISFPGDPFYLTYVESSKIGYNPVLHETGHGTGDVWGGRPAPVRVVSFNLSKTVAGSSSEQPRQ